MTLSRRAPARHRALRRRSLFLPVLICAVASCVRAPANVEWREYASDRSSSRYASLNQITAENVGQLEVAWRWTSPDEAIRAVRPDLWTFINQSTPIMVDGTLYNGTSMSQAPVIAGGRLSPTQPFPTKPDANASEVTLRNEDPALYAFDPSDGRQLAKGWAMRSSRPWGMTPQAPMSAAGTTAMPSSLR